MLSRIAYWSCFILAALVLTFGLEGFSPAKAQEARTDRAADDSPAPAVKKAAHRLPPFFAKLVDGLQRERIYKLQDEYAAKIRAAEEQLRAVQQELMAKIEQVLTDEQQKRLAELRAAAQARRDAQRAAAEAAGTGADPDEDPDEDAAVADAPREAAE